MQKTTKATANAADSGIGYTPIHIPCYRITRCAYKGHNKKGEHICVLKKDYICKYRLANYQEYR